MSEAEAGVRNGRGKTDLKLQRRVVEIMKDRASSMVAWSGGRQPPSECH